jgi:hypothetical protein
VERLDEDEDEGIGDAWLATAAADDDDELLLLLSL